MTLGERLKKERLKKDINQVELAKYMNVSKQTVSNWENDNRIPDTLTLAKLAEYFNCSTDYLLGIKIYKLPTPKTKQEEKAKEILNVFSKYNIPIEKAPNVLDKLLETYKILGK